MVTTKTRVDHALLTAVRWEARRMGIRVTRQLTIESGSEATLHLPFTGLAVLAIAKKEVSTDQAVALIGNALARLYLADGHGPRVGIHWIINTADGTPLSRLCDVFRPITEEEYRRACQLLQLLRFVTPLPKQYEDPEALSEMYGVDSQIAELLKQAKSRRDQPQFLLFKLALEDCLPRFIDAYYAAHQVPGALTHEGHVDTSVEVTV